MIATTDDQSFWLSFYLDPNTADLSWYRATEMYPLQLDTLNIGHGRVEGDQLIPAWSLDALIKQLPKKIEINRVIYNLCIKWEDEMESVYYISDDNKKYKFKNHKTSPNGIGLFDNIYQMANMVHEEGLI